MSIFDRAVSKIERNWKKDYNCIPFSGKLPRFSEYLPGIMQNTYYIVTGSSKTGKTQFTDNFFLYLPYDFALLNPGSVKIFYNSLEIDLESKIIQGIGRKLFLDYGLVVPQYQLISMSRNRMNEELYQKIVKLRKYFEPLNDIVTITDAQRGPKEIYQEISEFASSSGKVKTKRTPQFDPKTRQVLEIEEFDQYIPNDPEKYVIIITDHVSELSTEGFGDIKSAVEAHSDNMRRIRNQYGYTIIDVQQQSASKESVENFKLDKLEPSTDGLAESKLTQRKADVILGLFAPHLHDLSTYRGYDIKSKLGSNYRNLSIIRNRYGESNINVGLYTNPQCMYFEELPKADEFKKYPGLYDRYTNFTLKSQLTLIR